MPAKLNVVGRRVEIMTDAITLRVPAVVALIGIGSLLLTGILAVFDPVPVASATLDRQRDDVLAWEQHDQQSMQAQVDGIEEPLRKLRRQALLEGIDPAGDLAPSSCGGTPQQHFDGHAREAARLASALAIKSEADGAKALAMLPSRSPIELAAGEYDLETDRWMPDEIYVSSHEGTRTDPFTKKQAHHKGLDISAPTGTPVLATADGTVTFAGSVDPNDDHAWSLLGNYVEIQHGTTGFRTIYGHLSRLDVKTGQSVRAGDRVGAVGSTGHSTGPHLHYQVMKGPVAVDPLSYIADVVLTRDGESIRYQKGPSNK